MRRLSALSIVSALALAACGGGDSSSGPLSQAERAATAQAAAPSTGRAGGTDAPLARLAVPKGAAGAAGGQRIDRRLGGRRGPVDVWVTLEAPSVGAKRREIAPALPRQARSAALRESLHAYKRALRARQDGLAASLAGVGARELGRVQVAHNAIAVRVDAAQLDRIAGMAGVRAVRPVLNYRMTLAETVPYVGAAAVQRAGFDGRGVRVAVFDSGIDYTHRNLGGPGTLAAYEAAYGTAPGQARQTTTDGLFPTAKVVGGFDFVGEAWPDGERSEDPDPIDRQGHGTHVADIIAGRSADGAHRGVAPGAALLAVKACSAITTDCNGVALLKAMDFALDPNGDGDFADSVDVINMSLGTDYGQRIDELTLASVEAVQQGVVVVSSAGNGADRPYKVGSPSIGRGVISVAETETPTAASIPLVVNAPADLRGTYSNTAQLDYAPITGTTTGDVAFVGRGCPAGSVEAGAPADPYAASPLGKVALIDRGGCDVSLKIDRAAEAGATAVLIGLVAPGDAVGFERGGGDRFVPTLVITQALSQAIKDRLAAPVNVTLSPANAVALVGGVVGGSSRGPAIDGSAIKPEIAAPGASVSADVGTGSGESAFSGTSGATPMVAGAAALLRQAHPDRGPLQIKAMLMNSAETQLFDNRATRPGVLAPISRIGAGELRVDRALRLAGVARSVEAGSSTLAFGFAEVDRRAVLTAGLTVENFSGEARTYSITRGFRYADDAARGAVALELPTSISVPAGGSATLEAKLTVDGARLPTWTLDGGPSGGDGSRLQSVEFDGYVTLSSGSETLTVPWHALLRKSARTAVTRTAGTLKAGASMNLVNRGVEASAFDVFALTGTSPKDYADGGTPGSNVALVDLRAAGVRAVDLGGGATGLQFAVSMFGKHATPLYPAGIEVDIDVDGDGNPDALAVLQELDGFGATGQAVVRWFNLKTGQNDVAFFLDADLQSGNAILTVPTAPLGIDPARPIRYTVLAYDNYFSGLVTDAIVDMTVTPDAPRYAVQGDLSPIAAGASRQLSALALPGGASASPSQSGLLLMYRRNAGMEADVVPVR